MIWRLEYNIFVIVLPAPAYLFPVSTALLWTHPRIQVSMFFPPIKLSCSIAIRCGKVILKQFCSSYSTASLSRQWRKVVLAASEGWWVEDLIQPSVQLAELGIRDLPELQMSLFHICTNTVYILKWSFNFFMYFWMYFSSKRPKCFVPLAAVFGSSVLSGSHLTAWSKAGIRCIKENVMFLCSFSHTQTPLLFACAQCQSWLSQGVHCSLKHQTVKTWALVVLIVCSCMKHPAHARSPWNF